MQGLQALQSSLHPSVQPPATTHPTKMCAVHYAGNYAGSIEQHELTFCAQASCKENMYYAGTARNQPPQPTPAHDNIAVDVEEDIDGALHDIGQEEVYIYIYIYICGVNSTVICVGFALQRVNSWMIRPFSKMVHRELARSVEHTVQVDAEETSTRNQGP